MSAQTPPREPAPTTRQSALSTTREPFVPPRQVLGVVLGLSVLTPLGVYTGLLMPDVFASLAIAIDKPFEVGDFISASLGSMEDRWTELFRERNGPGPMRSDVARETASI